MSRATFPPILPTGLFLLNSRDKILILENCFMSLNSDSRQIGNFGFPDLECLSEAYVKASLIITLDLLVRAEGCDLTGAGIDG
jgi:hypothetical protein